MLILVVLISLLNAQNTTLVSTLVLPTQTLIQTSTQTLIQTSIQTIVPTPIQTTVQTSTFKSSRLLSRPTANLDLNTKSNNTNNNNLMLIGITSGGLVVLACLGIHVFRKTITKKSVGFQERIKHRPQSIDTSQFDTSIGFDNSQFDNQSLYNSQFEGRVQGQFSPK